MKKINALLLLITIAFTAHSDTSSPNRNFFYFVDGKTTQAWNLTLGDKQKWNVRIKESEGKSLGGQISLKRSDFKSDGDAVHLNWAARDGVGQFAITGKPIDLSGVADKVALTFDINVVTSPREKVKLLMFCDYPCRAEFDLTPILRKVDSNTWTSIPIPLSCMQARGLDVSKITSPFGLSTEGKLEVKVANIRMTRLADDAQSCD